MKFAKQLETDLVPEWRAKYLDYKAGKKKLKAVSRAFRNAHQTPRSVPRWRPFLTPQQPESQQPQPAQFGPTPQATPASRARPTPRQPARQPTLPRRESTPLIGDEPSELPHLTRYGSIVGTPPSGYTPTASARGRGVPSLELPDPALNVSRQNTAESKDMAARPFPSKGSNGTSLPRRRSTMGLLRGGSDSGAGGGIKRFFGRGAATSSGDEFPLEAFRDLDVRHAEFFNFLDMELAKVEAFYQQKEDEATQRLRVLRDQLHVMRDRRLEDLSRSRDEQVPRKDPQQGPQSWLNALDSALEAARHGRFGPRSRAMEAMTTPAGPQGIDSTRDYARRPHGDEVSYRTAKRKLKEAMQEYYRGLELLKSYALLNRTAFRKINKNGVFCAQ
ncbi:SPX-domain-containing protein [Trichodelitschia bisporula]|uniref:SPX-domain-containing protein n=1 Tax=Trichodelitschia bisporula TaxID=703511 RepID=A0A6G1I4P3_9PEZI|nr:SPX-domain-containing protein [Trichodelitschia bisporula]